MSSYSEFPPVDLFKQVLRTCPKSALLYASLWKLKTSSNKCSINRNEIMEKFHISPTLFRNLLLALVQLGFVSCDEFADFFQIDFHK